MTNQNTTDPNIPKVINLDELSAIIAINKPVGPTSHDIVDGIRRYIIQSLNTSAASAVDGAKVRSKSKIKVGHAGTLDPLASGILIIGIGRGTSLMNEIMEDEKEYLAEITLGATSQTDDSDGPITVWQALDLSKAVIPTASDIERIIPQFIGLIDQVPPIYSAIKTAGVPAYKKARAGADIKMQPRKVLIKNIKIESYNYPLLKIHVTTGKGVYIRALARDIGAALGTGAYMSALIRTRVGKWSLTEALTPLQATQHLDELIAATLSKDQP